jgi:hypothetical protein
MYTGKLRKRDQGAALTENRHRAQRELRAGFVYPSLLVCVVAAMGLMWYSPRDVRWGAALVGAGMLLTALIRLVLPASAAGMLATRRRCMDVGLLVPPPV